MDLLGSMARQFSLVSEFRHMRGLVFKKRKTKNKKTKTLFAKELDLYLPKGLAFKMQVEILPLQETGSNRSSSRDHSHISHEQFLKFTLPGTNSLVLAKVSNLIRQRLVNPNINMLLFHLSEYLSILVIIVVHRPLGCFPPLATCMSSFGATRDSP